MNPNGSSSNVPRAASDRKPKRTVVKDVLIAVALPWLMFFLIICLFLFTYHHLAILVWVLIALCTGLGLLFLALGIPTRNKTFMAIGLLAISSTGVATAFGLTLNDLYLERYYDLDSRVDATNVDPRTELAANISEDAGIFYFQNRTFVDNMRTIGFLADGTVYCIAPISFPAADDATVHYWAAGTNCCERRSNFDCGMAMESGRTAAIVADYDPHFGSAIGMAKAVYGMKTANATRWNGEGGVLLSFVSNPKHYKDDIWDQAVVVALAASMVDLLVCFLAGIFLYGVLQRQRLVLEKQQQLIQG